MSDLKNMKWISVKDKLPEDDETVWVINSKVQMLPVTAYYCDEYKEFISVESLAASPLSITHWMNLPKPPKDK